MGSSISYTSDLSEAEHRPAQKDVPRTEHLTPGVVPVGRHRPIEMPGKAEVSAAFNPVTTSYAPSHNVSDDDQVTHIKHLNIANRFFYG